MKKNVLLFLLFTLMACSQKVEAPLSPSKTPQPVLKKLEKTHVWSWDDDDYQWLNQGKIFDSEAKERSKTTWNFAKKAIQFNIKTPPVFHTLDNTNALLLKVFQLTDMRAFAMASKSKNGLKRLLTAAQIDPACIKDQHFFIHPHSTPKIQIDRVEGARYLGIILGYSSLETSNIARLIPIVTLDNSHKVSTSFSNQHPAVLKLTLSLGVNGIDHVSIDAR